MKKQHYRALIAITTIILAGVLTINQFVTLRKYEKAIMQRDSLLQNANTRDSVYAEKTKEYTKVITQYVNDCRFVINDKEIGASELIDYFNDLLSEKNKKIDSLMRDNLTKEYVIKMYGDSLAYYYRLNKISSKRYGVDNSKLLSNKHTAKGCINKLDSAVLLYDVFKSDMTYDSISNMWNIIRYVYDPKKGEYIRIKNQVQIKAN